MTEKQIIEMIVIYDGVKEYTSYDIFRSKELTSFVSRCRFREFPNDLLPEILNEKGKIVINTDADFTKFTVDLKNVSTQLYDRFFKRYES